MTPIPRRFISVGLVCCEDGESRQALFIGRNAWYLTWAACDPYGRTFPRPNVVGVFPPSMVTVDKRGGIITINVDVAPTTSGLPHADIVFEFASEILSAATAFYVNERPHHGWKLALAGCPGDNFKQHRKEGSH